MQVLYDKLESDENWEATLQSLLWELNRRCAFPESVDLFEAFERAGGGACARP